MVDVNQFGHLFGFGFNRIGLAGDQAIERGKQDDNEEHAVKKGR